jgi:hypothetical protein
MTRVGTRFSRRAATLLAIAATACVVVAGCGGSDGDAPAAADAPEPRSSQAFAEQLAEVLADADDRQGCRRIEEINRRSPEELSCPAGDAVRDRMDSFEIVNSSTFAFDRVAVVDYEPAQSGPTDTMVLIKDYDELWTVARFGLDPERAPANRPGDGDLSVKQAMGRYERAVRERDCRELSRITYRPAGTPPPSCREQLAATRRLARVLKVDPGQRPAFAGGEERFGIYSLTAYGADAYRSHYTFTVIRVPIGDEDRFVVLDAIQDEPMRKKRS